MIEFLALGAGIAWLFSNPGARPQPMTDAIPSRLTIREQALLSRISETPARLLEWVPIHVTSGINSGTIYVSPDYWGIGSNYTTYQRTPLTPTAAQWVADRLGASLPTRKVVDLIERHATIVPLIGMSPTAGESRNSQRLWDASNAAIQRRLPAGANLVAGPKKDVIIGNVRARNPGKVIIYGGRYADGSRVQATSDAHGDFYVDYSHGLRLIRNTMDVNGRPTLFRDVLMDRVLSGLVSDEGAVSASGIRYPL